MPESDFQRLQKHALSKGDLLISAVGTLGNVAIVDEQTTPSIFSCKSTAFRAKSIDPYFLLAYLNSPTGRAVLLRQTRGTVQTGLVMVDLRRLPVFKPSPNCQQLIGDLVRKAQNKFELAKQNYADAQTSLLRALNLENWQAPHVKSWTRNASQVVRAGRWDGEYSHPRYAAMIEQVPSTVDLVPLGRIVHLIKGIEVGGAQYRDEGFPFWRVANLTKQGMDESNVTHIKPELYNFLCKAHEPQQGELLLSKDGSPGIAHYLAEQIQGLVSGGVLRLVRKVEIDPYYLELVLNSSWVQMQVEQSAGGSIIKHWKPSEVRSTLIPRLSPDEERAIGDLVSQSHKARHKAKALLESAKTAVEIAIEQGENAALKWLNGK